jgi:hypothetical protein
MECSDNVDSTELLKADMLTGPKISFVIEAVGGSDQATPVTAAVVLVSSSRLLRHGGHDVDAFVGTFVKAEFRLAMTLLDVLTFFSFDWADARIDSSRRVMSGCAIAADK